MTSLLTIQEAWEKYQQQRGLCALTGEPIVFSSYSHGKDMTASLDRNSGKGYELSNIQWVHKDVNRMKLDLPQDKFLFWAKKATEYNTKQV